MTQASGFFGAGEGGTVQLNLITEVVGAQVDNGNPSKAGAPGFREIAVRYGVEFAGASDQKAQP